MIVALLHGELSRATPGAHGKCPECSGKVYARIPEHAVHHWAHTPLAPDQQRECSRDSGEMSEWHREWQSRRTDLSCIEVIGEGHRADCKNAAGHVIEFQRSSISPEDVKARENYWKRGVWVMDGTMEDSDEPRVKLTRHPDQDPEDPYRAFHWPHAPLLIYRARWPIWIDLGNRGLLQVRDFSDGRGHGWIVDREWFVDQVENGTRLTLRSHSPKKVAAKHREKRVGHAHVYDGDLKDLVKCSRTPVFARLTDPDLGPCCGDLTADHTFQPDRPLAVMCQLCPKSPTYWRGHKTQDPVEAN